MSRRPPVPQLSLDGVVDGRRVTSVARMRDALAQLPEAERRPMLEAAVRQVFAERQQAARAAHTCHAVDCTVRVRPEMLMCRKHWQMVPGMLRAPVWRAYRPGQCDDKRPSRDWLNAARAAIAHVAALEGKAPPAETQQV